MVPGEQQPALARFGRLHSAAYLDRGNPTSLDLITPSKCSFVRLPSQKVIPTTASSVTRPTTRSKRQRHDQTFQYTFSTVPEPLENFPGSHDLKDKAGITIAMRSSAKRASSRRRSHQSDAAKTQSKQANQAANEA